jgi:porin
MFYFHLQSFILYIFCDKLSSKLLLVLFSAIASIICIPNISQAEVNKRPKFTSPFILVDRNNGRSPFAQSEYNQSQVISTKADDLILESLEKSEKFEEPHEFYQFAQEHQINFHPETNNNLTDFDFTRITVLESDYLVNNLSDQTIENTKPRQYLTGDWGGFRSLWQDEGFKFDLEFTQFYQGLVSGTGSKHFEYGARLDGFLHIDTEKMSLWKGGGLHSHLEYRFGPLPGSLGGAFFPTNAGMNFATDSKDNLVLSSLYLSQKLGENTTLFLGKFNALDLINDQFFGGWGIHKFSHTVFVAPPSGLVPPVFFGAIASFKIAPVNVSFWVYDPVDRTDEYWPDGLFSEGVTFYLSTTYPTKIAGRSTTFSLTGIYSTKTGTDFSSVAESIRNRQEPLKKSGAYSLGFQISHLLQQNPINPQQGWGIFLRGSIADGNPNYVQSAIYGGIGGTGLFPDRHLDSFGIGYYYYNLSDDLEDSINDLGRRTAFKNEQGMEIYYNYAITPWFYIGGNLQYILPALGGRFDDAFMAGLRANIRF